MIIKYNKIINFMFGDQDKMVDWDKEKKKFVKFQHNYKIIHLVKLVVDIITL